MFCSRKRWSALGSGGLLVMVGLAGSACGNDAGAAKPPTAEFCLEAEKLGGDDAGPYSQFYDKHPEPTPADWGTDGHLVTDNLQKSIDQIKSLHPSAEAQPLVDAVVAALAVGKQNSEDTSQAGRDGDQAELDRLEAVNQDTNVPALMTAFDAVTALCQAVPGS